MFKRILVPLDGSELAENALTPAMAIAERYGSEVILLRAVQITPMVMSDPIGGGYVWPEETLDTLAKNAALYLVDIASREMKETFSLKTEVAQTDPASAIIDVATEQAVDLIVMTTHGYSGVTRWVLGSVTERVLRYAPCPVYAVRSAEIPSHILIPLDGSKLAETMLEPAITLAKGFNAKITFTRVDDPNDRPDGELYDAISEYDPSLAESYKDAFYHRSLDYLERIKAQYEAFDVPMGVDIGQGKSAERIIAVAERNGCDLIAMSTHGRTGMRRWRYGSVTERVLRNTERAMLVARPSDEVFDSIHIEASDLEMKRQIDRRIA